MPIHSSYSAFAIFSSIMLYITDFSVDHVIWKWSKFGLYSILFSLNGCSVVVYMIQSFLVSINPCSGALPVCSILKSQMFRTFIILPVYSFQSVNFIKLLRNTIVFNIQLFFRLRLIPCVSSPPIIPLFLVYRLTLVFLWLPLIATSLKQKCPLCRLLRMPRVLIPKQPTQKALRSLGTINNIP